MPEVRTMTRQDVPAIIGLGFDMHQESCYRDLDYDPEKIGKLCLQIVDDGSKLALVATKDGQIVGMLGAYITEHFFGSDKTAGDYVVYVRPEHRGSTAFIRLVRAYVAWAKDRGAKDIFVRQSTGMNINAIGDLYTRIGFEIVGYIFKKEATT